MVEAKQIGTVLFWEVEELDAIGPWEVLSFWTRNFAEDGYAVLCLSRLGGLVHCAKKPVVQAHYSYADAPPLEVLLYPGGRGTRPHLRDDTQLDWVLRQRDAVPLMTSVCTGCLVYAASRTAVAPTRDHALGVPGPTRRRAAQVMSISYGGSGGAVVNVSSAAATVGSPHEYVHYTAAKAGVETPDHRAGQGAGDHGVRVNAVAPGTVRTGIHAAAGAPDRLERVVPRIPMGRVGEPDEIAPAIAWLLGPDCRYVTGASIRIAGGL